MMDWSRVHEIAEEIALWESLIIHSWAILSAVIFVILRAFRASGSVLSVLLDAIVWGLIGVFWAGLIIFIAGLFVPAIAGSGWAFWLKSAAAGVMLFTLLINMPDIIRSVRRRSQIYRNSTETLPPSS